MRKTIFKWRNSPVIPTLYTVSDELVIEIGAFYRNYAQKQKE